MIHKVYRGTIFTVCSEKILHEFKNGTTAVVKSIKSRLITLHQMLVSSCVALLISNFETSVHVIKLNTIFTFDTLIFLSFIDKKLSHTVGIMSSHRRSVLTPLNFYMCCINEE